MLKEIARKTLLRTGTTTLYAEDYLDNGAKLCLKVNISLEVMSRSKDSIEMKLTVTGTAHNRTTAVYIAGQ